MEFQILGPLEVRREGAQVALGAAKQRALLAILLVHANELVSSDRLIEELWPRAPGDRRQHPSGLRGEAAQGARARADAGAPGELLVDPSSRVHASRRARRAGRRPLRAPARARAGPPARRTTTRPRPGRLREALELWRGPALADFTYDPFAQAEIARLEELRLDAVEERIEADLALGQSGRPGRASSRR